jgi:hypothetical protein
MPTIMLQSFADTEGGNLAQEGHEIIEVKLFVFNITV